MRSINTILLEVFRALSSKSRSFGVGDIAVPIDMVNTSYITHNSDWVEEILSIPILSMCQCAKCVLRPTFMHAAVYRELHPKFLIIRPMEHSSWTLEAWLDRAVSLFWTPDDPLACRTRWSEPGGYPDRLDDAETYASMYLSDVALEQVEEYNKTARVGNEFFVPPEFLGIVTV
jgi:hypothetical protein